MDSSGSFSAHINALEMESAYLYVRRRCRRPQAVGPRWLLLTDSQVTAGVLAKWRTSSRMLMRPLRRAAAYILASHSLLLVGWTKMNPNPADSVSRRWRRGA